jgi:hypothetical protein
MWEFAGQYEGFAREWLRRRAERPYDSWQKDLTIYTNNNTENALLCKPEKVFRFETMLDFLLYEIATFHPYCDGEDWAFAKRAEWCTMLPHRNKTADRPSVEETLAKIPQDLLAGIMDWARPDLEQWYDPS